MTLLRKKILPFLLFGLILFSFSPIFSYNSLADSALLDQQEGLQAVGEVFGADKTNWFNNDIRIIIVNIIRIVLGFLGIIFLVLLVFAGYMYMTAAGNEEQTKKAMGLIKNAIIGLVIVLAAWTIATASIKYIYRAVHNNVQIFDK